AERIYLDDARWTSNLSSICPEPRLTGPPADPGPLHPGDSSKADRRRSVCDHVDRDRQGLRVQPGSRIMEVQPCHCVRYRPGRVSRWSHSADEKPAAGAAATVEDPPVAAEADADEAA